MCVCFFHIVTKNPFLKSVFKYSSLAFSVCGLIFWSLSWCQFYCSYYFSGRGSHLVLVYAKTHSTRSRCITFFFMDYSVFKSSSPKSLSAKIRSSSQKWPNSFEQLHKTIPSRLHDVFYVETPPPVGWDCCWAGEEALESAFHFLHPKRQHLHRTPKRTACFPIKMDSSAIWPFLEIRYTFQCICFEALGYLNHFLVYFPRHKRHHVWNMWNENVKVFGRILSAENIFAYCSFSVKTLKSVRESLKAPLQNWNHLCCCINRTFQNISQWATSNTASFMKLSSVSWWRESRPALPCFSKALSPSFKALISYLNLPWIIFFFFPPFAIWVRVEILPNFCIPSIATPSPLNVVIDQAPAPTHLVSSTKKVCSLLGLC